ncbi:adenosylcobinamide amidohydrolase [Desulfospira joergensenii]|uniref:adenosylcobinamide amidohydrolase n=1 Tax=Desulfospira joergensenii TaxID=53329 RepID=UPI0003B61BC5|nr:adenosylcobinamide amidohydrolase [Desulfospira joergensenii]
MKKTTILVFFIACFMPVLCNGHDARVSQKGSIEVTDASGKVHVFSRTPARVVCLAPYITQMLVDFGRKDRILALTRQDLISHPALKKKNLGSYFNPDLDAIAVLDPDLVICPAGRAKKVSALLGKNLPVLTMHEDTMGQAFDQMLDLGRLFECEAKAAEILARIKTQLSMVKQRLAREKDLEKIRVVRVMAGNVLSSPGDDSFQNEMIAAAGGIVPLWGKKGFAVSVDPKAWQEFNPQVIYGCSDNADKVRSLLKTEAFKNVDAVKKGRIHMFPCEMTCRVSTRTGDFVQWLSAVLYPDIFADPGKAVTEDFLLSQEPVEVSLDYVDAAKVVIHRLADSEYKSLVIRFTEPLNVLSTFQGMRENVDGCGNSFIPMAASLGHMRNGVGKVLTTLERNLGFAAGKFATLMTGADMENLCVVEKQFKDLSVTVFATAGVKGNAMRMSKDKGYYFPHGTINIILGTNRRLSGQAMARSLITVTEAKTAALTDLDIRSSYTPWQNRATGTGTDNILVIQGKGLLVKLAGGHSKLAELTARAVHEAVTGAILKQNGIRTGRDIFQRLSDRRLSLEALVDRFEFSMEKRQLVSELESLLSMPYYAAFMESALAVSDARDKNLIKTDEFWDDTCSQATARICGRVILPSPCTGKRIQPTVAKAMGALIAGIEAMKGN